MSRTVQLNPEEMIYLKDLLGRQVPNSVVTPLLRRLDRTARPITIKSAKAKGRGLQQWVCRELSLLLQLPWGSDDSPIRSREMGQSGVDVILTGAAAERFPFAIECKSCQALSLSSAVSQARANAKDRNWMLVHKRKEWLEPVVIMSWEGMKLLRSLSEEERM